jgi:hypothetical protein
VPARLIAKRCGQYASGQGILKTMRKLLIILTFLSTLKSFGQVNDATRILLQKKEIEEQVQSSKKDLVVFVKVKGQEIPQRVISEKWPENIESTYNIFKNDSGQVVYFGEFPKSESGDWVLELKHYFDNRGQTFSFEKRLTFFNKDCSDGPVTEILTDLYLSNFKLLEQVKSLRDNKGNPIRDSNCGDPYNWPTVKKATTSALIGVKKIQL